MSCDPDALFRAYHSDLLRYLVRLSGDSDLAADAAQEAFVSLIVSPPRGQHRAWLFRVATNKLWDRMRTHRRRDALLAEHPHRVPTPSVPERPDTLLERSVTRQRVRAALEALSWRDRTLLLMREEGFSHAEIAEAVGTTTGSVGTMIARALRKLCASIEAAPPDGRPGAAVGRDADRRAAGSFSLGECSGPARAAQAVAPERIRSKSEAVSGSGSTSSSSRSSRTSCW